MTDSDKELIADYMGWRWCKLRERYTRVVDGERIVINWDMNDAGLCVQKMVEKGDWENFERECFAKLRPYTMLATHYIAWLFNPGNFFQAMAQWLRSKK